jgi:hypothetical protein
VGHRILIESCQSGNRKHGCAEVGCVARINNIKCFESAIPCHLDVLPVRSEKARLECESNEAGTLICFVYQVSWLTYDAGTVRLGGASTAVRYRADTHSRI